MWKFDLSSTNPNVWSIALSGQPIYQTADTTVPAKQPISAAPTLVKHPTNGYVVTFGTGKLFETGDTSTNVTQSLYGVWDSITPTPITQIDRTSLVRHTISSAIAGTTVITNIDSTTSTVALNYYAVSRNPVAWTSDSSTPRGWYIDLPNTGQRLIYPIEALAGTYAATDTVSPASVTANPCLASGSGRAWNYVIDLVTGSGPPEAIFSNNGGITGSTYVSGYENFADGRTRYIKNDALSTPGTTAFTPLSTQQLPSFSISCALQGTCSTTIIRTWRQLFMR
jgi:type IV pilus assembly protein PilY1